MVVRVDDNSAYMQQAYVLAQAANVHAMVDNWYGDAHAMTDYALTGPDRAALERFVATLPPPPAGHAIDYGRVDASTWRTYYVETAPILVNADFATGDPDGNGVKLMLTKAGGQKFEAASKAAVGHKLAFVVGDRIESAPVIETAILGGSLQITPGPHDDVRPLLDRLGCR
jgi:preprotein translocase subunit SecD